MFLRKKAQAVGVLNGTDVPVIASIPKQPLETEELEKLWNSSQLNTLELENYFFPPDSGEHQAVDIMRQAEALGFDPIVINPDWYVYSLAGRRNWVSDSIYNSDELVRFVYNYPLPYKAVIALTKFRDVAGRGGQVCRVHVLAPSPHLGVFEGTEARTDIQVDPMLIAEIQLRGRRLCYLLAQWSLAEDLEQRASEEGA